MSCAEVILGSMSRNGYSKEPLHGFRFTVRDTMELCQGCCHRIDWVPCCSSNLSLNMTHPNTSKKQPITNISLGAFAGWNHQSHDTKFRATKTWRFQRAMLMSLARTSFNRANDLGKEQIGLCHLMGKLLIIFNGIFLGILFPDQLPHWR